jgi:hypothetical protein
VTDVTRRTNIGPSIRMTTEDTMQIATEDTFVEDENGIRRLVAKGSRVPAYLNLDVKQESVDVREHTAVVVDEEASRPLHERREDVQEPKANAGIDTSAAEKLAAKQRGSKRQASAAQTTGGSGSKES